MPEPAAPIRILIADDHLIFRAGLRRLLEVEPGFLVVGEATDGEETVRRVRELKPDILLLDLAMPGVPGLEALRQLDESASPVRTILLTAAIEKEELVKALQLGAWGVVMKESAIDLLFRSIRSVSAGEYWVGRQRVSDLVQSLRTKVAPATAPSGGPKKTFGLTPREMEITRTIAAGYSNKEIAQQFKISEDTVKHHLSNIFNKTGVSSRLELALFAVNHQLVESA
jgi:two-component system, NarL family, nitrate/nitrite response regulator NarL